DFCVVYGCREGGCGQRWRGFFFLSHKTRRRDLPCPPPFVLAPTTRALFPAIADDCIPVAIGFGLIGSCNLKRECFIVPERWAAIEAEAGDAHHGELDRQHVPFLPRRKVCRCAMHHTDRGVGERLGVEACRVLRAAVVPKA